MTGPAGPAVTPDAQVAAGGKGFKAELDGLRERMRGLGFRAACRVQRRLPVQRDPRPQTALPAGRGPAG
jgi:hypothetical protein